MVFVWWSPCIMRPCCAADGEAGGARGGTEDVHFLKQLGLGEPCVSSVKTHPYHFFSYEGVVSCCVLRGLGRATSTSSRALTCLCRTVLLHRGSTQSGCVVFPPVTHSHHKTSRSCVEASISAWEQRKKRRFGGGAPCESRKTVTLILFYVLFFVLPC